MNLSSLWENIGQVPVSEPLFPGKMPEELDQVEMMSGEVLELIKTASHYV